MPEKTRIAVIGCGQIAQHVHLPLLRKNENVEIVAICENDETRRQSAAQMAFGDSRSQRAFASTNEMWRDIKSDAALVCLPSALHSQAAIDALENQQHVYIEKPIATNLSDANRVLDAANRAQKLGVVGFNYRFNAVFQGLKSALQNHKIGEVVAVRSVFSTAPHDVPTWKQKRENGGGVLLDLASHHIDLLRFSLDDEIVEVNCSLRSIRTEDDSAILQLKFSRGIVAQSFFSLCAVEEDSIEVFGTNGKLRADRYRSLAVEYSPTRVTRTSRLKSSLRNISALRHAPYLLEKLRAPQHEPSYETALKCFVASVRAPQNHETFGLSAFGLATLQDGWKSLAVVEAAQESARNGRNVVPQTTVFNEPQASARG